MIDVLRDAAGASAVREASGLDDVHAVRPRMVVTPETTDACAATLGRCSEHGWTVEVAGGRSARSAGRPVGRIDVLLSTARLNGVVEYEPDDLTIGVAAGTSLAEVRARVAKNRQRVPLDSPNEHASVGGVLARAAAGPMRYGWSTPKRQTLGLEVVTGDGRVLRVGGRVVKNVAGYDMNKLFVGSAGTLGVITRAHLRLLPIPNATTTLCIDGADVSALLQIVRAITIAPVPPAAVELTGPTPWRLLVRYEGAMEAITAGVHHAAEAARSLGAAAGRDEDAFARLAVIEADAAIAVRVADLSSRLADTLAAASELAGTAASIAAHAGDGIARVLFDERAGPDANELARAIERTRAVAATVVVERGPAALMREVDPWGPLPDTVMKLTRELKRQFDPAGILQRGRWIA